MTQRPHSIINRKNCVSALVISLAYHFTIILFLIVSSGSVRSLRELAIFFIVDTALWCINLVPLLAVWRSQIAWYDPLFWLYLLLFGMTCAISLVYAADPSYVLYYVNYGSDIFRGSSEGYVLLRLAESELLLLTFAIITLIVNRRLPERSQAPSFSQHTYGLALGTAGLCFLGGAFGFIRVWSRLSFVETLILNMGSVQKDALEIGSGRYFVLQEIAITALPLGLIGFLGLKLGKTRKISSSTSFAIVAITMCSVVPGLIFGSRLKALFIVACTFIVVGYFGYSISRKVSLVMIGVMVLITSFITIYRGNPAVWGDPIGVLSDWESIKASYFDVKGNPVRSLLEFDRVGNVAFVLEATSRFDQYTYGESLAAGPRNLVAGIMAKTRGDTWNQPDNYLLANEQVALWRYGHTEVDMALPPSYAGEYYMQYGWISLVVLSGLFGIGFNYLRNRIGTARSLGGKWALIVITMTLTEFVAAEISVVFTFVIATMLPVLLVYSLLRVLFPKRGPGATRVTESTASYPINVQTKRGAG